MEGNLGVGMVFITCHPLSSGLIAASYATSPVGFRSHSHIITTCGNNKIQHTSRNDLVNTIIGPAILSIFS